MDSDTAARRHRLGREAIHTYRDNALPPRLTIAPGDTCVFETREPSQGGVARDIVRDLEAVPQGNLDPELTGIVTDAARHPPASGPGTELGGHALTGPVFGKGAEPGDTLLLTVVEVAPARWGWTACGPGEGGGLLHDELQQWTLHLWDLRSGTTAIFAPGIGVPIVPFCGVMGVAPAAPGRHRTTTPRRVGGNMDVRELGAGATLALPIDVPGAPFSGGDAHAAQGDREVAGTGIEMDATVTLRFDLVKGTSVPSPEFRIATVNPTAGPWFAATGHDPDLYEAAREALRGVLAWLGERHGSARPQACILASACVDLRISQIVNGGRFTVSAFLPLSIFAA